MTPLSRKIAVSMARRYGASVDDIFGRRRFPEAVAARSHVWSILYQEHGYTMARIGRIWQRDHTTIMHGINKFRVDNGGHSQIDATRRKEP